MPRSLRVIVGAMGKYDPLHERLTRAVGDTLTMSFREIDELVQGLPRSARLYAAWWANEKGQGHVEARAWMGAGWNVDRVDFGTEQVTFRRA